MDDGPIEQRYANRAGGRFRNPGKVRHRGVGDFLRWRLSRRGKTRWPRRVINPGQDRPPQRVEGDRLRVSYIGHVTLLVQTRGLNILTDPVWSSRASPVPFHGPRRVREPGVAFEHLPPIDIVLVSHNHYDHLDRQTLCRLHTVHRPLVVAPLGNERWLRRAHREMTLRTLDWGEGLDLAEDVRVNCEPMHHWSARGLFDRNRGLWGAFVIQTPGGNILFIGDSGYGDGDFFRGHRRKYGAFRVAFIPIGAYSPRWLMADDHMDPDEAVQCYKEVGAHFALATHYEVFPLADDAFGGPRAGLERARRLHQIPPEAFRALEPGEAWEVPPQPAGPARRDD
jgi:L-ascorbate metabolism protein UlaG (beta-lactamase superfamily)